MFYEEADFKDMLEISQSKDHWCCFLVSLSVETPIPLEPMDFINWSNGIRSCLSDEDAAFHFNKGNVIVLLKNSHIDHFYDSLFSQHIPLKNRCSRKNSPKLSFHLSPLYREEIHSLFPSL